MRWILLCLAVWSGSGCTHHFLQENTLRSSTTLSSLQTQQVLDNLAMLDCNAAANPNHVNLSSGLVQATDQGSATFLGNLFSVGPGSFTSFVPSLSAQRGLVQQWSISPIADGEQLETLRIAYQRALHPEDAENNDAIIDQIVGLCVRHTLLPKKTTIEHILKHRKSGAGDDKNKPHKEALKLCATLHREIVGVDTRIARLSHYLKEWQEKANPPANLSKTLELEMQILDLHDKRAVLESQHALLMDLAGLSANKEPRGRSPGANSRQSPLTKVAAETSATTQLILTALQAKAPAGYLPATDLMWESARNPAIVDQAEDQIARFEALLFDDDGKLDKNKFKSPWLLRGCKADVPRCACYVGRYKECGQERYVWIMPEHYPLLREFTQTILSLAAPSPQQDIPARSPAFSPSLR
jgi:hypothetical protein